MSIYFCNNNYSNKSASTSETENNSYSNYEYSKLDTSDQTVFIDLNSCNSDENNNIVNNNNNNNNETKPVTSFSINISKNISKLFQVNGPVTVRQVKLIVIPFGIRLLLTGLIWDHYVNNYQFLLQNYTDNIVHRVFCFF